MTKKECIKKIREDVYGRYAEDLFIKLFNVVSDYQMDGEDDCLDNILDDYMDEATACEYVQHSLDDYDLCTASKCIRDLHKFSGVYRTDGYGWLEDVDYGEVYDLRNEILNRLGYDPEADTEEDEDAGEDNETEDD